ncbi:MAG: hypothetical protein E7623_05415 [Ruminococcaceae bacterium]|nr:hypothetical protein [Oscillospiraceae bacterium]
MAEYSKEAKVNNTKKINFFYMINIVLVSAVLVLISLFLLLADRPEVSETEKRKLAEFPEFSFEALVSGEYAADIREWYNDTVPERDSFKDMGASILELTGVRFDDVKFYGDMVIVDEDETEEETETEAEKETEAETAKENETEEETGGETDTEGLTEKDTETEKATEKETEEKIDKEDLPVEEEGMISNNILVYKKRAIMLYGGSLSNAERYSNYVNNYKKELGDSVNVYSMAIPTAVAYYLPDKYKDYTRDQKKDIDHMASFYNGVEYVDVYGTLLKHTKEDIYLRTDHHWQPLGAYYAAQNFCKSLGLPFADLSKYEKVEVEGYVGSMYGYTGDAVIKNNPETFIYYKPQNSYSCYYYELDATNGKKGNLFFKTSVNGSYCAFIGTDKTVLQIKTDNQNGRKLMIIKDSYGNALVPFLTGSFEEIWVIDMRYFETNSIEFIKNNGITDLLFASCMFSACGGNAKYIEYIRTLETDNSTAVIPMIRKEYDIM